MEWTLLFSARVCTQGKNYCTSRSVRMFSRSVWSGDRSLGSFQASVQTAQLLKAGWQAVGATAFISQDMSGSRKVCTYVWGKSECRKDAKFPSPSLVSEAVPGETRGVTVLAGQKGRVRKRNSTLLTRRSSVWKLPMGASDTKFDRLSGKHPAVLISIPFGVPMVHF